MTSSPQRMNLMTSATTPPRINNTNNTDDDNDAILPPMFALDQVQFSFPGELSCLTVSNNGLAIVLKPGANSRSHHLLLLIDLSQSQAIDEVEIQMRQKGDRVSRIFLDPSAQHLILSTRMGDVFYLQRSWKTPRHLSKMRGIVVESVGWDRPTSTSTGVFLIGSRKGHIYEAELSWPDEFSKKDHYFKQIFSLHDDGSLISGIIIIRDSAPNRASVAICTADHLFQFNGDLHSILSESGCFGNILNSSESKNDIHNVPRGSDELGQLSIRLADKHKVKLSWLTSLGIYSGSIQNNDLKLKPFAIIPFPFDCIPNEHNSIMQIVQSEYHFILLYRNCVRAIKESSGEMVYEEQIPLESNEHVLGLVHDSVKHTYWVWTNRVLYELLVTEEDRHMWSFFLQQCDYEQALIHAKLDAQREKIQLQQAEYLFNSGKFKDAAKLFAASESIGFEDAGLRLIESGDLVALKDYLFKKLGSLPSSASVQISTISTWLVDVFLNSFNQVSDGLSSSENLREFYQFLKLFKDHMDLPTVYHLLKSNGRTDDFLFLAEVINDMDSIIFHWIQEEKWHLALSTLAKMDSPNLYYKYASELLLNSPNETVNLWIQNSKVNPRLLLPALIKYNAHSLSSHLANKVSPNYAIRYLLHITESRSCTDIVVHNYTLYLLALYSKADQQQSILRFLNSQHEEILFDPQYALRVCLYHNLAQACILIYSLMGLFEQAVDMALQIHDIKLAQIQADKPEDDDSLRKRLWLKIAGYIIEDKDDVHQAVEFIKNCNVLKFEDILPLFSDFVHIDIFKNELCESLIEYKDKLNELTSEMDAAILSAEHIRAEINLFKNRCISISESSLCSLCDKSLLTQQFYIFPCHHLFHMSCLVDQTIKTCSSYKKKKIEHILDLAAGGLSSQEVKIDVLCAEQCHLCGDAMIKSVQTSLLELENDFGKWEI